MACEEEDISSDEDFDTDSSDSQDDDIRGQEASRDGSKEPRTRAQKTRLINLYRLDRKFTWCGNESFDDITKSHAETVKCVKSQKENISCEGSRHFKKGIKWIFTTEQSVLTESQVEAKIGPRQNAFSITYFETKDGDIYAAGNGSSYHYLKKVTDHEFPEWVLDRNLEDNVLEVHGKGLHGRIALFSETFRQVQGQMENLWVHMNSLTTKLKVSVRADSELGKVVCHKNKKVFVDVNFENNSVQVKTELNTDDENNSVQVKTELNTDEKVLKVLDALVSSFQTTASRQCAQLRLVSRVREPSVQEKLDEKLNDFLEKTCKLPPAAVGQGAKALSKDQECGSLVLHAYDKEWNNASKIALKVPGECPGPSHASTKKRKTRQTIEYQPYEEPKEAFVELYKIFEKAPHTNFLNWLKDVDAVYGKKTRKLLSLMECRFPFLLEDTCHMYFHGQWLTFCSDFHSLLEVHFLELMKTRSVDTNYILPLAWPKSKNQIDSNESDFAKFLATWLVMKIPTDETCQTIQNSEPYEKLMKNLRSDDMHEPQYNEMYALVGQLLHENNQDRGFVVGDGVTLKGGLELFDLLYYDEKRVFFIHVKKGFSANNMRIVVDQVRQSADFIQCLIFRGESPSQEELRQIFKKLKYCTKSNGTCHRHGNKEWICKATSACMRNFSNVDKFIELLKSREKHFILAYGGTKFTKAQLDEITGEKVDEVLKKHHKRVQTLSSKGYVKEVTGGADEAKTFVLTSRFCTEKEDNFVKCMRDDEEEMTDVEDLPQMFKGLKGAISTTETSAGKMALLNLFGCFNNYQSLKLHVCRIDHQFPGEEAVEELMALFETLHL